MRTLAALLLIALPAAAHERPTQAAIDYLGRACTATERTGVYLQREDAFRDLTLIDERHRVRKDETLYQEATKDEQVLYSFHCHLGDDPIGILPSPFTGGGSDIASLALERFREYVASQNEHRSPRPTEARILTQGRVIRYRLSDRLEERIEALARAYDGSEPDVYVVQDATFKEDKRYWATIVAHGLDCGTAPLAQCAAFEPDSLIKAANRADVLVITDEGPF